MSMKRNYFALDGKSSTDFGAWVARSNAWDGAMHDDSSVEVPGRNGALVYSNGRWHNFELTVTAYIPKGMQTNVDGLRGYLANDKKRSGDTITVVYAPKAGSFELRAMPIGELKETVYAFLGGKG